MTTEALFWHMHTLAEAMRQKAKIDGLTPIERKLTASLADVFLQQGRLVLRELGRYQGQFVQAQVESRRLQEVLEKDAMELILQAIEGATAVNMAQALMGAWGEALAWGALQQIAEIGISLDWKLDNPRALKWLEGNAATKVTKINEATRNEIRDIVSQGMEQHLTYDQTARAISDRFSEFAVGQPQAHIDSRAHLVAVNESAIAYGEGQREAVDEMAAQGIETEKSWLVTGGNICDDCLGNADDGWIPRTEAFSSGVQNAPAHPACRCDCTFQAI
jgi:hypothetical protein